jgi:hypothetical protein
MVIGWRTFIISAGSLPAWLRLLSRIKWHVGLEDGKRGTGFEVGLMDQARRNASQPTFFELRVSRELILLIRWADPTS